MTDERLEEISKVVYGDKRNRWGTYEYGHLLGFIEELLDYVESLRSELSMGKKTDVN